VSIAGTEIGTAPILAWGEKPHGFTSLGKEKSSCDNQDRRKDKVRPELGTVWTLKELPKEKRKGTELLVVARDDEKKKKGKGSLSGRSNYKKGTRSTSALEPATKRKVNVYPTKRGRSTPCISFRKKEKGREMTSTYVGGERKKEKRDLLLENGLSMFKVIYFCKKRGKKGDFFVRGEKETRHRMRGRGSSWDSRDKKGPQRLSEPYMRIRAREKKGDRGWLMRRGRGGASILLEDRKKKNFCFVFKGREKKTQEFFTEGGKKACDVTFSEEKRKGRAANLSFKGNGGRTRLKS